MKRLVCFAIVISGLVFCKLNSAVGSDGGVLQIIQSGLCRMRQLVMMEPDKEYTITIDGIEQSKTIEDIVAVRSGQEVLSSNITSGCSDYAAAFYYLMR